MTNMHFKLLFLITTPKLAEKAESVLSEKHLFVQHTLHARGTATSEIMDTLGLGSIDKSILICMLSANSVETVMAELSSTLRIGVVNSGIAFTLPIKATNNLMLKVIEKSHQEYETQSDGKDEVKMNDISFVMIAAIVNRGYSENVMTSAREAGASGGTVINSRYIPDKEMCKTFGISPDEEKEIVLTVVSNDIKVEVMKKICESCGMHSEAKGSVFAFHIHDCIGLQQKTKNED